MKSKKTKTETSKSMNLNVDGLHLVTQLVTATAKAFAPNLPAEVTNHLLGALQSKSWGTAVRVADSLTKQQYVSAAEHFAANQLALLVKKVPFKDPSLDPEGLAISKFKSSEHRCGRMNIRFRAARSTFERVPARHRQALLHAQAWVRETIGDEPNYDAIFSRCDFGPGASVGVHGSDTTVPRKLGKSGSWTVTPSCAPIAKAAVLSQPHLRRYIADIVNETTYHSSLDTAFEDLVAYVSHNKVVMVPKTALVHRSIAIEPTLNGFVQKGIDEVLRIALKRRGIDLRDQSRNQLLAKLGSERWLEFNPFVTIDLSAASDSLAIELVRFLLPPAWFSLLLNTRSPSYVLDDEAPVRFNKIASMGNGFCFPLETLIFASLVEAAYAETGDACYGVYGDDIIVRQSAALRVIELLNYAGFRTNTDKTFVFGPFRESCGADFFEGKDVRPYTLDYIPTKPWEVMKIFNEYNKRTSIIATGIDDVLLSSVPERYRFMRYVDGAPDAAFQVPMDLFMSSGHASWNRHTWSWSYKHFQFAPVETKPDRDTHLEMYSALRGYSANGSGRVAYALRRETRPHIVKCGQYRPNWRGTFVGPMASA